MKQNFSWTFAGNAANSAAQFSLLLIIAHLGTPTMVGQYGLGLAITAPIFLLTGLTLRTVQVTDVRSEYRFNDYALVRFLSTVLAIIVTVIIVSSLGYSRGTFTIVVLIGITKAIEGWSDIIFGVFQKYEQMDLIAKSMIVKSALSVLVFSVALYLTRNVILGISLIAVSGLVRFLVYDLRNLAVMPGSPKLRLTWASVSRQTVSVWCRKALSLTLLTLPVGLSAFLISISINVPRYVIEWSGSVSDLGVFTIISYPLVAGTMVISALSQSALPRLARYHQHGESTKYYSLLRTLILVALAMGTVAIIFAWALGEPLLRIVFGAEYSEHASEFLILVVGMSAGFVNWFLNSALHAIRAFRAMLVIQLIMVVLIIAGSLATIPTHGLWAASWVVTSAMLIQVGVKAVLLAVRPLGDLRDGRKLELREV